MNPNASVVLLFLLVAAPAKNGVWAAIASDTTTVDLSQDLVEAASVNASPGALAVNGLAASDPLIRAAIVLEHGKIVSSYVRDDVNPDVPWQVWSTTKSWISLLTGLMLQDGSLTSLNETLGDIFPDESLWAEASDPDFRKAVTVQELLTMSSGLVSPPSDPDMAGFDFAAAGDGGTMGGRTLADSLAFPDIGAKGEFSYLGVSNIMSYVILERTRKTPRQYLAENVLPVLGINDADINWWQNEDGVEYAYHGLELTPHQMAKFGQLYLARGMTGPDSGALVPAEWIDDSNNAHLEFTEELMPGFYVEASYGYLFWSGEGTKFFGNPNVGDNSVWCALGAGGQDICVDSSLGRVSVQQRDFNVLNVYEGNGIVASIAMDPSLTFEREGESTKPNGGPTTDVGDSEINGEAETNGEGMSIKDDTSNSAWHGTVWQLIVSATAAACMLSLA